MTLTKRAIRLRKQKLKYKEIAQILGTSKNVIGVLLYRARDRGLIYKRSIWAKRVNDVLPLRREGLKLKEIAQRTGLSIPQIWQTLYRYGETKQVFRKSASPTVDTDDDAERESYGDNADNLLVALKKNSQEKYV
jgi:transposase